MTEHSLLVIPRKCVSAGIALVLWMCVPAWADVSGSRSCSPKACVLIVKERITSADVTVVKEALDRTQGSGRFVLMLDSEGGDVAAAIEIGRLVRRWSDSVAVVSLNSKCFSACVFVLAGALHRTVHGKVGIHRPFGTAAKAGTYDTTQKDFRILEQSAKKFLQDVNIPASLFDEMMSVPPQKIRVLNEAELTRFGIGQNDPVYEELRDSRAALALGISKEEYLRRKARSERICNAISVNERKAGVSVSMSESARIVAACNTAVLEAEPDDPDSQPRPPVSRSKR